MSKFLLRRLREPSTWAGLVAVVTALAGWELDGAQRDAIVTLGTSLVGLLLVFTKESGDVEKREIEELRKAIKAAGDAAYGGDDDPDFPIVRKPAVPLPPDGKTDSSPDNRRAGQRRRGWPFGRRNV